MAPRETVRDPAHPARDTAGQATRNPALAMLRGALVAAVVVGVNAAAVAAIASGLDGLWGALLGVLTVVLFSGLGLLALHLSRRTSPTTQLAVALASYTGRIGVFGLLLALALGSESLERTVDLTALGLTALVVVMGWMAGEIWAWSHLRIPIYDLDREERG
jgi:ATP synthase protein I